MISDTIDYYVVRLHRKEEEKIFYSRLLRWAVVVCVRTCMCKSGTGEGSEGEGFEEERGKKRKERMEGWDETGPEGGFSGRLLLHFAAVL